MKSFEMLNAFRNGNAGQEKFVAELKDMITAMLETANEMLSRVPESVMMDLSICADSIELCSREYHEEEQNKYTVSYYPDEDSEDIVLATANVNETECLDKFKDFMYRRYGFEWSYSIIKFDETAIILSGKNDEEKTEYLKNHLKQAFPDKTLLFF